MVWLQTLSRQHIADKIDVTTLTCMTPCWLNEPVLTAASTAYVDKLKQWTTLNIQTNNNKQYSKLSKLNKFKPVNVMFDEKEFPVLATNTVQSTSTTTTKTTATSSKTATTTPTNTENTFDYKAELNRISNKIETKLEKHFATLFNQMDTTIDNIVKQYDKQHAEQMTQQEEQEKVNIQVAKQLAFLVNNMKRFLKLATPQTSTTHPLPQGGGQS